MNTRRKTIITLLFLLAVTSMMGQKDTVVVGYGETFETIANRYGITINELLTANPGKWNCFAGMKIIVPQPYQSPVGDKNISSVVVLYADSLLISAKAMSTAGSYNKAIKIYNKVISMGVRTPYAYAGRGECYFCLKKYKKAKDDMLQAIYSEELAQIEKEWCKSALEDIEEGIRSKRQRRKEIWSNIGLGVASVAAFAVAAYAVSEQNKMQNQYYQSSTHSSNVYGSSHLDRANQITAQSDAQLNTMSIQRNVQLNMMTQQMMIQAQQGKERLQRSFREQLEWASDFNKKNGRYPSEYEIDQWYSVHYPDLLETRILSRGKMASSEFDSEEKDTKDEYKGKLSPEKYISIYKGYEKLVEGRMNSLTIGGYKYEDKNGNQRGVVDSDIKGYAYQAHQMGMKEAQREMIKIRMEAAKYGVHITPSKWETATAGF